MPFLANKINTEFVQNRCQRTGKAEVYDLPYLIYILPPLRGFCPHLESTHLLISPLDVNAPATRW